MLELHVFSLPDKARQERAEQALSRSTTISRKRRAMPVRLRMGRMDQGNIARSEAKTPMTMSRPFLLSLCIAAATPIADNAAQSTTVSFNGTEFLHRWSRSAQHEFTPTGEEDIGTWSQMVTINVHDSVRTGEQLAELANRVLGSYQEIGKVIRTDSKPRTDKSEAEHFAVALLPGQGFMEAAFARFLLHEGRAVVAVYSRRSYGDKAAGEMGAWLKNNGSDVERALMAWTGLPSQAALNGLPHQR